MNKRNPIKTTSKEAVSYWSKHVDESKLSVDWNEAETHCWRCGCRKNLQRCHIIPDALGGEDKPDNIVLLCGRCHADGPNVSEPQIMWDWIRAYCSPFYETFWSSMGMKEYKFIYHKRIFDEINDIFESAGIAGDSEPVEELIRKHLYEVNEMASIHFGQPYFNSATLAGLYRMMLANMATSLGVCFPIKNSGRDNAALPWWKEV